MLNMLDRAYIAVSLKTWQLRETLRKMREDESGGTAAVVVEIVMVGMVLVLAFVFRKAIGEFISSLFNALVTTDGSATPPPASMSNPFG